MTGCEHVILEPEIFVTDEVAEWLRRWTANPMGSARVGSNPILVVNFIFTPKVCVFFFSSSYVSRIVSNAIAPKNKISIGE